MTYQLRDNSYWTLSATFMQVLWCNHVCFGARSRGVEGRARNQYPSLHAPFHLAPWRAACGHTGLGRWCDLFSPARGVTCAFPCVHLTVWTSRLHVWYETTLRWHWSRWLLSHQCLITSVRWVLSALGKGFFSLTLCQLPTSTQSYGF